MSTTNLNAPKIMNAFQWISAHWFAVFLTIYGLWVFVPFLAPVFMQLGWTGAGKAIYFIYSFFCHQLPERSFFFFGEKHLWILKQKFSSCFTFFIEKIFCVNVEGNYFINIIIN